jgi:hypothetical protein
MRRIGRAVVLTLTRTPLAAEGQETVKAYGSVFSLWCACRRWRRWPFGIPLRVSPFHNEVPALYVAEFPRLRRLCG